MQFSTLIAALAIGAATSASAATIGTATFYDNAQCSGAPTSSYQIQGTPVNVCQNLTAVPGPKRFVRVTGLTLPAGTTLRIYNADRNGGFNFVTYTGPSSTCFAAASGQNYGGLKVFNAADPSPFTCLPPA